MLVEGGGGRGEKDGYACLMDVTSHPLLTAALHIRDPRKPLPPQTTRRLAADMMADYEVTLGFMWRLSESCVGGEAEGEEQ